VGHSKKGAQASQEKWLSVLRAKVASSASSQAGMQMRILRIRTYNI
jgi:hypothetical protein